MKGVLFALPNFKNLIFQTEFSTTSLGKTKQKKLTNYWNYHSNKTKIYSNFNRNKIIRILSAKVYFVKN